MSSLHSALKYLGPTTFQDVPSEPSELDTYLSSLFAESQVVLDSIPIADPSSSDQIANQPFIARSAAEIKLSAARSAPPSNDHLALQKEWGKPIKLGAKDNPLGMSVYKTSGKDGKGAWFARHSVHEGIGFSRFKKSLQQEFEESLAVKGAPGEGNIRGIGGEERVELIDIPGKGKVEVFRLSAQFPGPTTPRDFVTLLVTSDNAIKPSGEQQDRVPRHYIMISKPCDHPATQPQSGFIRGSYESVEFIREIPRKLKTSMSTTDLEDVSHKDTTDLGKQAAIRNAKEQSSRSEVKDDTAGLVSNPATQTRSRTAPDSPTAGVHKDDDEDEQNPVEWIMVTRSDPGGSVPRFMVERGTPASICADASKFLDWACQSDDEEEGKEEVASTSIVRKRPQARRDSFQSFRSSRLAGLEDNDPLSATVPASKTLIEQNDTQEHVQNGGFVGAVVGAVSAYTPQMVLDRLPGGNTYNVDEEKRAIQPPGVDDDAKSVQSTTSFQSAEDGLVSDDEGNASEAMSEIGSNSSAEKTKGDTKHQTQHEKQLAKLEERRIALESKFAASRSKLDSQATEQSQRDEQSHSKAMERHDKELKKHEDKYQKEMKKLEERQQKERKKLEEKKHKQEHKNDILRISRERDEAKKEAELARKEAEMLKGVIADLQKENTVLVAKLGKLGSNDIKAEIGSLHSITTEERKSASSDHLRSHSSSSSLKKLIGGHH